MKFRNEPKAMPEVTSTEGLVVMGTGAIQQLTADTTIFFQKLWLYPGKAVGAKGVLTANGAAINVGKSGPTPNAAGAAVVQYLPDILNPTDLGMQISLPLGQKMQLAQILISGTAGDGVFYSFT